MTEHTFKEVTPHTGWFIRDDGKVLGLPLGSEYSESWGFDEGQTPYVVGYTPVVEQTPHPSDCRWLIV